MSFRCVSMAFLGLALLAAPLRAQVKTQEKTKMEFAGPLGGMMKVFGGSSYKNGTTKTVALKGDRKMTITDDTAELIDLAEEKIYQIDMKGKSYRVLTFEQLRKQMQDAMEKAKAQSPPPQQQQPTAKPGDPQMEIEFKLQESGQKKTIAGYNAREVLATVLVYEKGKKPEDGAMQMTSSMWLAPKIPELKQIEDFDLRYAQKMILPFAMDLAEQQQMAPAMGAYPGLGAAMGKLETEKVNMDGTSVSTVIRFGAAAPPDQKAAAQPPAQQPKPADPAPKTIGGLLGGLGKKAITSNNAKKEEEPKPASDAGTLMTSTEELVSLSTAVTDADVSIPAGFKEKK